MALVAVVVVGLFAGVASQTTTRIVRADREAELLFRGQAYRAAIARYHAAVGQYPRTLHDLLKDPHRAQTRYLRTLYADPMADAADQAREGGGWRLLRAPDGGIAGVASGSRLEPLKKTNFPLGLEKFEGAARYEEWTFDYVPVSRGVTPPVSVISWR